MKAFEVSPLFFGLFGSMAIAFSLLVVIKRRVVASAFSLVMVFFSFGAIYALLGAHLVAALQILIYAGAIMVLFVFVIMLLNAHMPAIEVPRGGLVLRLIGAAGGLAALLGFILVFKKSAIFVATRPEGAPALREPGNTQGVSELLFTQYALPFELTSVVLLAAIVGAVILAKRKTGPQRRMPHAD